MGKYIDVETVRGIAHNYLCGQGEEDAFMSEIDGASTSDVVPIKHGKWKPLTETQGDNPKAFAMYRCSACGRNSLQHRMGDRFCSQCGAEMEQSPGFRPHPFYGRTEDTQ